MDWHLILGAIAGILQVSSIVPYIRGMLYGTTRPNKITMILWLLLGLIQLFAQIDSGASWSVFLTIALTFNAFIITILAFSGYGYTKHGPLDYVCFFLALVAIIVWQSTGEPNFAIAFAIIASILAATPTIVKTYRFPETENVTAWAIVAAAAFLGIFSTSRIDFANLAIPGYQLLENVTMVSFAYFGQRFARR